MTTAFDALLVVSFGGPEGPADVLPFLENVVRGRNVPRQRLLEVAQHYYHFGGVSPINAQNRALVACLSQELAQHGIQLPTFFGNRNWQPLLPDTLKEMSAQGIRHALAFITSPFSSYSSCRQYLENLDAARQAVGPAAPEITKLRAYFNHPGYLEVVGEHARRAWDLIPVDQHPQSHLLFTAHSIPLQMAATCPYEAQLREASGIVAGMLGAENWELVYQSRSGSPHQPWLEPDVGARLRELAAQGVHHVVLVPIGFISDHIEVLYDLDVEAQQIAQEVGLQLVRAQTVGTHPRFITMIRQLIEERLKPTLPRLALGSMGPAPDECLPGCCGYRRGS